MDFDEMPEDDGQDPRTVDYWWGAFEFERELAEERGDFDYDPKRYKYIDIRAKIEELKGKVRPETLADLVMMFEAQRQAAEEYERFENLTEDLLKLRKLKDFLEEEEE